MLYKDVVITTEMLDAMVEIVSQVDENNLLGYVRSHKNLANGFKITKAGSGTFRKRLIAQLRSTKELDEATAAFLYENGLGNSFFLVLSAEAIQAHLKQLCIIFGRIKVLLALLLDKRPELNELATLMLEVPEEEEPDDLKCACAFIVANMAPFVDHFTSIMREVVEGLPENDQQGHETTNDVHNEELQRLLNAEQKKNGVLSQKLKENKEKTAIKLAAQTDRITKLTAERDELRRLTLQIEVRATALQQELEKNRQELDATIELNVTARLDLITNRWLQTRETIDHEVQQTANCHDLIAKADIAISQQQQTDRHTGNRHELQKRLHEITGKLAEVRDAIMSAMHPLDELKNIETKLHVEADHLAQLLGNGKLPELSPLAKSLAVKITAAPGSDALHQYEMLLKKLSGLGLSADDCSYLQGLLFERFDQMLAIHGNDRNLTIIPHTPALRFRQTLAQDKPVTLVCDGHNIINTMEQFEKVRNRDHAEARQLLVETVITQLQPYPNVAATIVYDGPDHDRLQVSNNVTVIYSGGGSKTAKHRADKRIEELLNWRSFTGESTPVFLVTNDYDLGQEAQQNRAIVIPLEQFKYFLP